MNGGMTIGKFSRQAGVSADTVRFYEREGLLEPVRSDNNYRVYGPADLGRMDMIKKARASGFTLADVREMLELIQAGRRDCADFETTARRKLNELDEKIRVLQEARARLAGAMASCRTNPPHASCELLPEV